MEELARTLHSLAETAASAGWRANAGAAAGSGRPGTSPGDSSLSAEVALPFPGWASSPRVRVGQEAAQREGNGDSCSPLQSLVR